MPAGGSGGPHPLEVLLEVTFPVDGVSPEEVVEVLKQLTLMLRSPGPPQLRKLVPRAIAHVVEGGQAVMTPELCVSTGRALAEQLAQCRSGNDDALAAHLLWALGSVCAGNGPKCTKLCPDLLNPATGVLLPYICGKSGGADAHGAAVYVVGELAARPPGDRKKERSKQLDDLLPPVLKVLLEALRRPLESEDLTACRNLCTAFKAVTSIVLRLRAVDQAVLPSLLAVIKLYMFYEHPTAANVAARAAAPPSYDPLSRHAPQRPPVASGTASSDRTIPPARGNSGSNIASAGSGARSSKSWRRKDSLHSGQGAGSGSDSESERSDWRESSGGDGSGDRPRGMPSYKIRQSAMACAQAVIQCAAKSAIFGYWQSFIPNRPQQADGQPRNLLHAILQDPSPRGRIAAIGVLTELLSGYV